jgi:putative heme iron utilization protein
MQRSYHLTVIGTDISWSVILVSLSEKQKASLARAQVMNKEDVNKYFNILTTTLHEHGLTGKPANIHNVDETGYNLTIRWMKLWPLKAAKMFMSSLRVKGRKSL